ncbi:hypothetical protein [Selenomonas bovis]|uniref:hypothetical protein n=1 Tax=Selenomonas bovis TaxID=416586 RepID=UPI003AB93766
MSKWYIDKIKAAAPELLDGEKYDIMDWIDNAFGMYAEDTDVAAKMDDAVKEQEEYYNVALLDCMSRNQLLTVVAKLIDVTEGESC